MATPGAARARERLREQRNYAGQPMPAAGPVLRAAVAAMSEGRRAEFARTAGVNPRAVARFACAMPINASEFLAMCSAAGIGPVTGLRRIPSTQAKALSFDLLGAGCRLKRFLLGLDLRDAGKEAGIGHVTIFRCEQGSKIAIESVLAICAFIGVHPDHYMQNVSRESTETSRGTA